MLNLFDCDGVLIDSEIIAAEVDAEHLAKAGLEITAEEIMHRFAGSTIIAIKEAAEQELGRKLPDDFVEVQRAELDQRLAEEVDPMEGIHDMLDVLEGPRCVCSNSSANRLKLTLERTQLYSRFEPNIFSAQEVGTREAKPLPNVYLYGAKQFGADPAECVVLEDSAVGVTAAKAAGMRVVGFTGAGHSWPGHADALTDAGADTVINRMADFPATAAALRSWRRETV